MNFIKFLLPVFFLFSALSGQAQEKNIDVYVFVAEECPICIYMANPLREAVKQFGDEVNFTAVFPNSKSSEKTAARFLEQYELAGFSSILDKDQSLTRHMGATVTPEVVVFDRGTDQIIYRGRISDAYLAPGRMKHGSRKNDLLEVLSSVKTGKPVPSNWPDAVGCFITFKKHH